MLEYTIIIFYAIIYIFKIKNTKYGNYKEYRKTIKADLLIIKITNLFTGDIVSYDFKIINDNICFYSSNNRYEIATEKLFFDEMMSQAQETIGG